jgi:hypothetical protein
MKRRRREDQEEREREQERELQVWEMEQRNLFTMRRRLIEEALHWSVRVLMKIKSEAEADSFNNNIDTRIFGMCHRRLHGRLGNCLSCPEIDEIISYAATVVGMAPIAIGNLNA